MDEVISKADQKNDIHYKFVDYSGRGYTLGNIVFAAKDVIYKYCADQPVSWHDLYSNPQEATAKFGFLTSSFCMWALSNQGAKGMAISNGIGCISSAMMVDDYMSQGNVLGATGYALYATVLGYGTYTAWLRHQAELKKPEQKENIFVKEPKDFFESIAQKTIDAANEKAPQKQSKLSRFISNAENMIRNVVGKHVPNLIKFMDNFPNAPVGIAEAAAAGILVLGACVTKDPIMFGIATLWMGSSGLLVFSKEKSNDEINKTKQPTQQPKTIAHEYA